NAMRIILLDACEFDWGEVSPAIFGGLFESVIDKVTRRKQGAHYTPEDAILKLIGPLFLDELRAEFERAKGLRSGREEALKRLHDRLANLTFFDPACGAGNFLVVAYRELRELERELVKEIYLRRGMPRTDLKSNAALFSRLNVDQFFGIEIDEFPARIAEVALWMTDHIANVRLGEDFGESYARIPLVAAPGIHHGDALEIDWDDVLPAERCSYILGNPPFVGFVFREQSQQRQAAQLLARLGATGSRLDYVAAWFLKAAHYVSATETRAAFIGTNSITQGEQVAQLWPAMFRARVEIYFAHRTFIWPGHAAVHCVIVGFGPRKREPAEKRLFSYVEGRGKPLETRHGQLTAYLFDATEADRHLVVRRERASLSGQPLITVGTKPVDGGHLIYNGVERRRLLAEEPGAEALLRPFVGGQEFINGIPRWLLHAQAASPSVLRSMPVVRKQIAAVRKYREEEGGALARALAHDPTAYHVTVVPEAPFLVIPEVSSERRDYVPIGWLEPPTIPSNQLLVVQDATLWHFGVLTSAIHMAWLRHIGGRLESRYRYSSGLVYNTFPWPEATPAQRAKIEALAQAVLDARALPKNATSTLADLYDPNFMPSELRKAHRDLDVAVDRLYRARPFGSDRERVEHLFPLYEALVQPTAAAARANRRTARRVARTTKADGP
ncbi:MAG TPA: DNA methyltransferase, partial [Allosphingosinicella sp.]